MKSMALNLTDSFDNFLTRKYYVIMDRDANFSAAFRSILKKTDVQPVRLPPHSLNLNAYVERFHSSIKSECLNRMVFFGERSLRRAVNKYLIHDHAERNHQSLETAIIDSDDVQAVVGRIKCRERLGGMLKHYDRDAA